MHITVAPASTKTGQATIQALLDNKSSPTVTGVYRDLAKVPAAFSTHANFTAVKGDVMDAASLDFAGTDALLAITPPQYAESDMLADARAASANTKAAAQRAGVRRLVLLSSVGAQLDHGTGEILTNHTAETIFAGAAPEVVFVRCAYFMENWLTALETVHADPPFFFTTITPLDYKVPMVSVTDIGSTCAAELLATGSSTGTSPHVFELWGPAAYSSHDVQAAFSAAAGRPVEARPIPPEGLQEYFENVLAPSVAAQWAEMSACFLPGGILEQDVGRVEGVRRGVVGLEEAVKGMYAMEG